MKTSQLLSIYVTASLLLSACSTQRASFSLMPDQNTFTQDPQTTTAKIDVLWVVDNSGSMDTSQQNVADNFASFIDLFLSKKFDFNMAVTTTDAYRALFSDDESLAKFRDGTDFRGHSGVYIIDPDTANLEQTFLTNIMQGVQGNGDERAFQSMQAALDSPLNTGFPRPGAFLAVIIVSDEDDFSHDTIAFRGGQYSYSGLHTVDSYITYLDELTNSTPANRNYSVNAISILDKACLDDLNSWFAGRKIGYRYLDIAQKTGGIIGSLCDAFGPTLAEISARVIELATQFYLNREPREDSIVVVVNGVPVPKDAVNGWTYNADANSIVFHGSYIPESGSIISVSFDPISIK